jgi:hypothetical protein
MPNTATRLRANRAIASAPSINSVRANGFSIVLFWSFSIYDHHFDRKFTKIPDGTKDGNTILGETAHRHLAQQLFGSRKLFVGHDCIDWL